MDVDIKTLSLTENNLNGELNLSRVSVEALRLYDNDLSVVRINQLKGSGILELNDNRISSLSLATSTVSAGYANFRNNYFNVDDIYYFVQKITLSSGSYTINVSGNPCWVNNALDASHPDTAACLALASSKNISIIA